MNAETNKTEQCFITKSQAEWFLEKYLPSSTYYLEKRKEKMIAPSFTSVCEMITTYNVNSIIT